MPYTPFNKPIGTPLDEADLQGLITNKVSEGQYVEYKGADFPANAKIGHSLASFANAFGGWYIVGVETDGHNVAVAVPGFSPATTPDPIAKVRDIAKSHINPMPAIFPEVVTLANGNLVLVTYIPGMQETPFVTKDGRIYRRKADSSEPVYETDRHAIDRLNDQGSEVRKVFQQFCQDDRTFSQGEQHQGWLKVFLSPYPLGTIEHGLEMLSSDGINHVFELSNKPLDFIVDGKSLWSSNIAFNVGMVTPNSLIVGQPQPASYPIHGLSAELYIDGRAKFFVPLPYMRIEQSGRCQTESVQHLLDSLMHTDDSHVLRFIDVMKLILIIAQLTRFYCEWVGESPALTDLQAAIVFDGVWRSVPLLDIDAWAAYVARFSLPIIMRDRITDPYGLNYGRRLTWGPATGTALALSGIVGLAIGLPRDLCNEALGAAVLRGAGELGRFPSDS